MAFEESVARQAEPELAPPPVNLTARAAEMVKKAREEEGLPDSGLRIGVIGGGCSGLQYLLDFAPAPTEDDFVSESFGVSVYVDPFSAGHLVGTIIDYVDTPHGAGFKFNNPNIQRSCGCSHGS